MRSPDSHELGILPSGHLSHMQTKQRLANKQSLEESSRKTRPHCVVNLQCESQDQNKFILIFTAQPNLVLFPGLQNFYNNPLSIFRIMLISSLA